MCRDLPNNWYIDNPEVDKDVETKIAVLNTRHARCKRKLEAKIVDLRKNEDEMMFDMKKLKKDVRHWRNLLEEEKYLGEYRIGQLNKTIDRLRRERNDLKDELDSINDKDRYRSYR